jgi:ribosomal protein S18 acetylase RimI-like enzyme
MPELRYGDGVRPDEFLALAQRVWPGTYTLADVTAALARTTNLGAWDGDGLVGSVRVLTDGHFLATVPEIFVLPEYRRRGIGRELMRLALERAPRGKLFFGAQPESVAFFDRIGCKRRLTGFVATRPLAAGAAESDS